MAARQKKSKIICFSLIISSPGWVFCGGRLAGRKKRQDGGGKKGREPNGSGCSFSLGGAGVDPQDGQISKGTREVLELRPSRDQQDEAEIIKFECSGNTLQPFREN